MTSRPLRGFGSLRTFRGFQKTGVDNPLPVHVAVIGVGAEDTADGAVVPGSTGKRLLELCVTEFRDQLQRRASLRGRQGDDFVEGVVVVVSLPRLGLRMDEFHDL